MNQIGPPHVPPLLAVGIHPLLHGLEAAIRVEGDVLRERVEEIRHRLVASQRVVYDPFGMEQADVLGGVDYVVHEENVGGDLAAGADVEALEGHEVEVGVLGGVVDDDGGEAEDAVVEADVEEAGGAALAEADAGFVELDGGADDAGGGRVGGAESGREVGRGGRVLEEAAAVEVEGVEAEADAGGRRRRFRRAEFENYAVYLIWVLEK